MPTKIAATMAATIKAEPNPAPVAVKTFPISISPWSPDHAHACDGSVRDLLLKQEKSSCGERKSSALIGHGAGMPVVPITQACAKP